MKNILPLLLIIFFTPVNANSETEGANSETAENSAQALFQTINQRLSYMEDVALYKAINHLPIEDVKREKLVLEKAKQAAKEKGLAPGSIEAFFKTQIAVAKAIQYRYRADLLIQPTNKKPRDLKTEVRPALIRLGDEIILGITNHLKKYGSFDVSNLEKFSKELNVRYVKEKDKEALFEALKKIDILDSK